MNAVNTMHESLLNVLDDVPPPPPSYTKYVERVVHDRMQAAYEMGLNRGARLRLGLLLLGLIVGWVAGFVYATMREMPSERASGVQSFPMIRSYR
jgi:hypothetical protein